VRLWQRLCKERRQHHPEVTAATEGVPTNLRCSGVAEWPTTGPASKELSPQGCLLRWEAGVASPPTANSGPNPRSDTTLRRPECLRWTLATTNGQLTTQQGRCLLRTKFGSDLRRQRRRRLWNSFTKKQIQYIHPSSTTDKCWRHVLFGRISFLNLLALLYYYFSVNNRIFFEYFV
jgi:hypothetical protein